MDAHLSKTIAKLRKRAFISRRAMIDAYPFLEDAEITFFKPLLRHWFRLDFLEELERRREIFKRFQAEDGWNRERRK